ncbi:MAG: putative Ig domain-containing protein [Patescibacteria group bacterium]
MKVNLKVKSQKSKLKLKTQNFRNSKFEIRNSRTRAFTLIELIVSVALLLVALSIALFAVVGTNGMIQKADARSSISESTRGVGEAIRRTVANAPVGAVTPIIPNDGGTTFAAIQVKAFSDLQSGNTCTVIGRAIATTDSTGEEKYTINKVGTVIAILIYNVDSGGLCPTTSPIYQNRLTNVQAVVKAAQFAVKSVGCTTITSSCVTKQLLRYSLTLEAAQKGSGGTSEARKPTLTIQEGLPIGLVNEATVVFKIETTTLPNAHAGTPPYATSVVVSGGMPPYTWAITSGSLPNGLALSTTTGVITGTPNPPTAGHTYNFTVTVTDSATPIIGTASQPLSIFVIDDQIVITTTTPLPDATVGVSYNPGVLLPGGQLKADRGVDPAMPCSCTWTIISGGLPNGMSMSAGGKIDGTPTTAGVYSFLIRAAESSNLTNYAEKTFSLTVSPSGGQTLTITTSSPLPSGSINAVYVPFQLTASGSGSYTWTVDSGSLPPGLALSTGGIISGTPTCDAGKLYPYSYSLTIRVRDNADPLKTATKSFNLTISDPLAVCGGGLEPG